MKKVIFCTNLPSPYRVDFFNELGKLCDLTVLYERHSSSERNSNWKATGAVNFKEVYLDLKLVGVDRSKGPALKNYIKTHSSDVLILTNYVSPATMEAIFWCRLHSRKYCIEYDGGFNKKDSFLKGLFKKVLLKGAIAHFTTADEHIQYLQGLGIESNKIHKYPFTSISEDDIAKAQLLTEKGKDFYKKKLGVCEEKMILTVGRFSYQDGYGKGYDILMKLAEDLDKSIGIYIVGDEPTPEFVEWKSNKHLDNVHFVGFKNKSELAEYYAAADLFTLLSRGDVWGLVVNEAMIYELPVITSTLCIAGTELVTCGKNGFVLDLSDYDSIKDTFGAIIHDNSLLKLYGKESLRIIQNYTISKMANTNMEILETL